MKRWMALLLLLILPLTVLADGPLTFSDALQAMDAAAFARQCEATLADTTLAGATVAEKDGAPVITRNEYYAFAVMRRTDGLLMLCSFVPAGTGMLLEWHNDLLVSYYQDLALSTAGAAWSGGTLPELSLREDWLLDVTLHQPDGTQLALTCDQFSRGGWRVTQMALYVSPDGENFHAALTLPEDCLAEDIYLATCKPDDWRRGEREEPVQYGW